MVDARVKRQGKRFYYKDVDDAKVKAEALERERSNNGIEALAFPTELRVEAAQAHTRLKVWDATISQAVDHYVRFLQAEQVRAKSLSVEECVDRYVEARQRDHHNGSLSKLSLYEITARAKQFGSAFQGQRIRDLDRHTMQRFLDDMPVSARTKVNVRLRASKLFNWLRDQDLISENPVERIRVRVPENEIRILSLDQIETLLRKLESADSDLLAFAVFSLWGFMRVGEIHQLKWEHVDGSIEVKAASTKVRRRRFITLNPVLIDWLQVVRRDNGLVVQPNFRKRWAAATNGIELSINILRHSAISYGLAYFANRPWLAEQAGTSVQVIAKSYLFVIPKHVAEQVYALRPKS